MANNNSMASILNAALAQAVGSDDLDTLASYDFIDGGKAFSDFNVTKEQFTQALINVKMRNLLTDGSYAENYKDPFYKDAAQYGAITQLIHVGLPTAKNAKSWQDFSGGNVSVGSYTCVPPTVSVSFIEDSCSWCVDTWTTGEQWDTAFRSEDERDAFISAIFLALENSLTAHLESLNEVNRNTFIARKFDYAGSVGATGVHVVNAIQLYVDEVLGGADQIPVGETITVEDFLNNKDMMIFAESKIMEYIGYMYKMTTLFNVDGFERFVPRDRLVVQILDYFEKRYNAVARSSTFHDELIALPEYQNIPAWQALYDTTNLTFDVLSAIDIQLDNATPTPTKVQQSGIIALIADNWCIGHTTRSRRQWTKYFEPENLYYTGIDCRDSYWNNLSMNAVVFYLEDVESTAEDDGDGE